MLKKLQQGKDIVWKGKKVKVKDATYIVKGKIISFIFDTGYCSNAVKLAKNADLVITESTYLNKDKKLADERNHLTAKQAATIAKKAGAKKLYLIHISRRYKNKENLILKEAKEIFPATYIAKDLMTVEL